MKDDFDALLSKFVSAKEIIGVGEEMTRLAEKYGVSHKTCYNRFKSMYGKSPTEYIRDAVYPSKDVIDSCVLNSSDSAEFFDAIDLPLIYRKGIFDREYGVSTFQKAKLEVLSRKMVVDYNPMREDNRSLWYSQLLGDGYYSRKKHVFVIVHGHKQAEYLKWKVALINKAYPKTPSKVSMHTHKQGHTYYRYYSGNIGNIDIPEDRSEVVGKLTPLGWLLWFFDDGFKGQSLAISCTEMAVVDAAIAELETYGIKSRKFKSGLYMCGQEHDLRFYKNFIEPFIDVIPNCMKYKVEDIVGGM